MSEPEESSRMSVYGLGAVTGALAGASFIVMPSLTILSGDGAPIVDLGPDVTYPGIAPLVGDMDGIAKLD